MPVGLRIEHGWRNIVGKWQLTLQQEHTSRLRKRGVSLLKGTPVPRSSRRMTQFGQCTGEPRRKRSNALHSHIFIHIISEQWT